MCKCRERCPCLRGGGLAEGTGGERLSVSPALHLLPPHLPECHSGVKRGAAERAREGGSEGGGGTLTNLQAASSAPDLTAQRKPVPQQWWRGHQKEHDHQHLAPHTGRMRQPLALDTLVSAAPPNAPPLSHLSRWPHNSPFPSWKSMSASTEVAHSGFGNTVSPSACVLSPSSAVLEY